MMIHTPHTYMHIFEVLYHQDLLYMRCLIRIAAFNAQSTFLSIFVMYCVMEMFIDLDLDFLRLR